MKKYLPILLIISSNLYSAELTHNFNSPTFSGSGYSSHILTVEQLEDQGSERNESVAAALKARIESESLNSPQARFIANLESRIYSQLAKQLTDSMFGEGASCTVAGVVCGSVPDLGGNSISWKLGDGVDKGLIVINITSLTNPANTTTMKVPSGTFFF